MPRVEDSDTDLISALFFKAQLTLKSLNHSPGIYLTSCKTILSQLEGLFVSNFRLVLLSSSLHPQELHFILCLGLYEINLDSLSHDNWHRYYKSTMSILCHFFSFQKVYFSLSILLELFFFRFLRVGHHRGNISLNLQSICSLFSGD